MNSTQTCGLKVPVGHIIVNSRWKGAPLVSELQVVLCGNPICTFLHWLEGAPLHARQLKNLANSDGTASVPVHFENSTSAVDFHPSCNTGAIYISEADVVDGTAYKRRAARLRKANSVRGLVFVEKTVTTLQYFFDVQKFCVSDLGLFVVPVANQNEAAGFLVQMVYAESKLDCNPFLKPCHVPVSDVSVMSVLTTCPGVGESRALTLLEKFPSLDLLCKASQEELSSVIGRASASKLYDFFHRIS